MIKSCEKCAKCNVCKYRDRREKVAQGITNGVKIEDPFSIQIICSEFKEGKND